MRTLFQFLDLATQPRPEIASAMASKRRKPLQLQFSIHEKSDGEDNEEESVFLDNNPEIVTSVVSDEEDEVTTSPSLTFGVVDPRGQRTDYRYFKFTVLCILLYMLSLIHI